jgi:hypothetical protein
MTTPAEYRQWAEECLQAMRAAMVPEVKATLRAMAERWFQQAKKAERQAHLQSSTAATIPDGEA